ncbi:MAG: N-acetylmuramoyl-L-alanine amidase family protein [Blautia sp.]|nr:N-acetylmuramoyl-L-alanine amidase family protein [Blautia sp.]
MQSIGRKIRMIAAVFFLLFAAAGISTVLVSENVEAATANGFVTRGGNTYYYKNGKMVKGWLTLNGKKYYFWSTGVQKQGWLTLSGKKYYFAASSVPANRYMATGWRQDKQGVRRYFDSNGVMATGWKTIKNEKYFFESNGAMKTGWKTEGTKRYYFQKSGIMVRNKLYYDQSKKAYRFFTPSGVMVRQWYTTSDGNKRYFSSTPNVLSTDGLMQTGFTKIGDRTFYFQASTGYLLKGWVTRKSDGAKFYMDPNKSGSMVVNTTRVISGVTYVFDKNGVATVKTVVSQTTSSAKTIKNYLKNALQPVGQCLYVWGGWGHATTKGVPSSWKTFYNSYANGYNYNSHRFEIYNGVDCSGFVGWAAYQVMQTKSGGPNYTVVSGSVGSSYVSRGWGSIITQSALAGSNYKIYAGDVGYDSGHTWIMLGQCADGSCVVLHSTNNAGVQLAGTPTPAGNYSSQAVALAKKYMAKYPNYTKYQSMYKPSTGNFIKRGNFLRWNRSTLADPDGYLKMTADKILADLYK